MTRKFISASITGLPNAGKSTLLNAILGMKLSIVSPKIQTTRKLLKAAHIHNQTQILFLDTPGLFKPNPKIDLERKIVKNAWDGVKGADVIVLLIDCKAAHKEDNIELIQKVSQKNKPIILVLNKIDLLKGNELEEIIKKYEQIANFNKIISVSASNNKNILELLNYLEEMAEESDWLFEEDFLTDSSVREIMQEITREQLYNNLSKELPYSLTVSTEKWQENEDGSVTIHQLVNVLKDSQKSIIIGKNASMIKKVNMLAREEMEKFLGQKVHLIIHVKSTKYALDEL